MAFSAGLAPGGHLGGLAIHSAQATVIGLMKEVKESTVKLVYLQLLPLLSYLLSPQLRFFLGGIA